MLYSDAHLGTAQQTILARAIREYHTAHANDFDDLIANKIVEGVIAGLTNQIITALIHDAEAAWFRSMATPVIPSGKLTLTDVDKLVS